MSFANSGDPKINPKEGDFGSFPAGDYDLIGIEDFFTTDQEGYPTFKPTKSNDLKCHCHFKIEGGGAQLPAWSGTATDYYNLAKALGANVDGLEVESTTHFLLEIEKRINAEPRYSSINVGENGWVKKIKALLPKKGTYRLAFLDAFSLDKTTPISFQDKESKFGVTSLVRFQFKIISDAEGYTDYAGNTFLVDVQDPFDGVMGGLPAWKKGLNGGMLKGQRRLETFMGIFCPDVENHRWVSDLEQSEYGIDEAANPIVVIVDYAKRSGRHGMAPIDVTENGYIKMDLQDLYPVRGASVSGVQPIVVPVVAITSKDGTSTFVLSEAHKRLMSVINNEAYPSIHKNVFDPAAENPYAMTPEGGEWCKAKIAPIWDKLKLGEKRNFSILTDQQADDLAKVIRAEFDTSTF